MVITERDAAWTHSAAKSAKRDVFYPRDCVDSRRTAGRGIADCRFLELKRWGTPETARPGEQG